MALPALRAKETQADDSVAIVHFAAIVLVLCPAAFAQDGSCGGLTPIFSIWHERSRKNTNTAVTVAKTMQPGLCDPAGHAYVLKSFFT